MAREADGDVRLDGDVEITGSLGIGVASSSVQGEIHIHDGTGGMLFVSKTAIDGTAQTIIPNGTGDVTARVAYSIIVKDSSGDTAGSTNNLTVSSSTTITTVSGNSVDLRVNADGSVDIRRTAGSRTFSASMLLNWM